ncbi:MAG: SDR family oxidoreductase [Clostridiales bacterium]|jgi:3-oxoacyl-[acyl-carrier protein] reductase|nr:SDR family oxidoreductase [Clostridiales bacterium]
MLLAGKTALVTGGARGLGRCIAKTLAAHGAKIALIDIHADELQQVVTEIRSEHGEAIPLLADVSNSMAVSDAVQEAKRVFGSVHILVNNAGNNRNSLVRDGNPDDLADLFSVHVTGSFNCIHAILKSMREQKYGRIINIASVVGLTGVAGTPYYAAAKAGLMGLTRATAAEVAIRGITVNAIAAGYIETGLGLSLDVELKRRIIERIPMARFAAPEEITEVVSFLASEKASYITGTVVNVSGGFYM